MKPKLKVELPLEVSEAITDAVNKTFEEARNDRKVDQYPPYLSKKEVCDYLGISHHTLNAWISNNNIPYKKIGRTYRFSRSEIDGFMHNQTV